MLCAADQGFFSFSRRGLMHIVYSFVYCMGSWAMCLEVVCQEGDSDLGSPHFACTEHANVFQDEIENRHEM